MAAALCYNESTIIKGECTAMKRWIAILLAGCLMLGACALVLILGILFAVKYRP